MPKPNTAVLAIHYQNENCHPDGKIRVGIAADADWRWERLGNAKRLLDGARARGAAIIHVRLAVPPDYRGVSANTDLIREWMDLNAWQEDTWGTAFIGYAYREAIPTGSRCRGFRAVRVRAV